MGANGAGETSGPSGLSGVRDVSLGAAHSLVLKNDGTLTAWGWNRWGAATVPAGLNNVKAISAGSWHNLAVKTDGTVVTWGLNAYGLMNVPTNATDVVAVSGGNYHSLALRADGTVVAWGYNVDGETDVPAGLNNVRAIEAGYFHSLALKNDGTVVGWGYGGFGQTTTPAGVRNAIAVSAGNQQSLAVVGQPESDTAAPTLNLPRNLTATATSAAGAAVTYSVTATDSVDPDPRLSCANAAGTGYPTGVGVTSVFPVGATQLTCTARDRSGNTSTGRFAVNVTYGWAGIRPPISAYGTSVFKTGASVPVKFALGGPSAGITSLRATLSYALYSQGAQGPWTRAKTKTAAATGNQFRYAGGQYIFDWSTTGLAPGVYRLRIDLGDGSPRTVQVTLKR